MKKKELSILKQNVDSYVRDLNTSINAAVNKFFAQMTAITDADLKGEANILPCTVTFEELVNIVEELYNKEKPFTTNLTNKINRVSLIRQITYHIGSNMGHSYNYMYTSLNNMYGGKVVKNHSTIDHSVNKINDLMFINDPKCMTLRNQIINAVAKYVDKQEHEGNI
jgi:hypothetical protein